MTTTTNTPATEWAPVTDPADGLIAFQSSRGGDPDVWVQNMATGAMTRVTSSTDREAPGGWYHDAAGARILFCGDPSGTQIFSIRPDGTGRFAVTDPVPGLGRFAVSGNGTVLAAADLGDGPRIYTFPIDPTVPTSRWTPVSTPPSGLADSSPTFAPNGDVVFARSGNGVGRLMRVAAGTAESTATPATQMLQQGVSIANPSFSSSGKLAYSVNPTTAATTGWEVAIATVGADGTVAASTVFNTSNASQPVWTS